MELHIQRTQNGIFIEVSGGHIGPMESRVYENDNLEAAMTFIYNTINQDGDKRASVVKLI